MLILVKYNLTTSFQLGSFFSSQILRIENYLKLHNYLL